MGAAMPRHAHDTRSTVFSCTKGMIAAGLLVGEVSVRPDGSVQVVVKDATIANLRALIHRAHDAMSRREPDGVSEADWDRLVADLAMEVAE
jgi:hypothetical protein